MNNYIIIPFGEISGVYLTKNKDNTNTMYKRWKKKYNEEMVKGVVMQDFITNEDILEEGLVDLHLFICSKCDWTSYRLYICEASNKKGKHYCYALIEN